MNNNFGEGDLDLMGYSVGPVITYTNNTDSTAGGTNVPYPGDFYNVPATSYPPYIIPTPIYPLDAFPTIGNGQTLKRLVKKEFVPSEEPSRWRIINVGKLNVKD